MINAIKNFLKSIVGLQQTRKGQPDSVQAIISEVASLMEDYDINYFYDVKHLNRSKTEYVDALLMACKSPEYETILENLKVGFLLISRFQNGVGEAPVFLNGAPDIRNMTADPEQDLEAFRDEYLLKQPGPGKTKILKSLEKLALAEYQSYLRLANGVTIRFYELIAKRSAIEAVYPGGFTALKSDQNLQNDDYNDTICRIDGAMSQEDIDAAVKSWEQKGLELGKDMVVVQSMFGPQQEVDWLEFVIEGIFVGHMVITHNLRSS